MWFGMSLWAILTTSLLICECLAYSNYAEFETSNSGQYPSSHKASSDYRLNELDEDRNSYLYGTNTQGDLPGGYLDLNSWPEKDSDTSRQLFGDKSSESSETLRTRVSDINEDDDMPKNKRESHSLSIVNPLDVLRQRLMLEMARRRMKENQDQIRENAVILKNLGKRAVSRNTHEDTENQDTDESRTNQNYLRRIYVSNSKGFDV